MAQRHDLTQGTAGGRHTLPAEGQSRGRNDVVTGGPSEARRDGLTLAGSDVRATAPGDARAATPGDVRGTAAPGDIRTPTPPAPPTPPTGDLLAVYLRAQATEFLRALRLHRETGAGAAPADATLDAARALRRSARRISGSLHTFRPLLDPDWSEQIRPELAWLSGTLALEHACEARLERLLLALHRLSGAPPLPDQAPRARRTAHAAAGSRTAPADTPSPAHPDPATSPAPASERGTLTVGAAKAGALLDRQLTLARTRAHSTALQALGSSRFHAVADKVALLASEVPLTPTAQATPLAPLAGAAEERLTAAVTGLPLLTAGHPYNAEALIHGLSPETAPHPQDTPWHQVRLLLRLHRYALEVLHGGASPADARLQGSGEALDRHRDASEAAAAAAHAARTPRIAPATAYALGVLHADQRHEVEAARYAFHQSWQARTPTQSP